MNSLSVLFVCVTITTSVWLCADAYRNPSAIKVSIVTAEIEKVKAVTKIQADGEITKAVAVAKIKADADAAHLKSVKELLPAISDCRAKLHEQLKSKKLDSSNEEFFISAACTSFKSGE